MVGWNVITNPDFSFPLPLSYRVITASSFCLNINRNLSTDCSRWRSAPKLGNWACTTGSAYSTKLPKWYIFKTVLKYALVNLKERYKKYHTGVSQLCQEELVCSLAEKEALLFISLPWRKVKPFRLCIITDSYSTLAYPVIHLMLRNPLDIHY